MNLESKTAIVTGGTRGIGLGIAKAFVNEGAFVTACGRSKEAGKLPAACQYESVDVSDTASVNRFASRFDQVDILVCNAGIQIEKNVVDTTDEDWNKLVGTNMFGVFNVCRAFIPLMSSGGSIITIGSISGHLADYGMAVYNASKSFVHGLTRSVAIDHGPHIRCNAICPGWIETGMLDAGFASATDPSQAKQDALNRHPVRRFGQPADIAAMAVWLASDESMFATGQLFTIDGGLTAATPLHPGLF